MKSAIVNTLNVCNDHLALNPGDAEVERIRAELGALNTESSISFAEAKYKVLMGELSVATDWKFDWEPAGYSWV